MSIVTYDLKMTDLAATAMRQFFSALSLLATLAANVCIAQQQFEVASIRESAVTPGTEGSRRERVDVSPNSVLVWNASLNFAIQWAYGVRFYQISGPDWLKDQRYDIQARTQTPQSEKKCAN